MLQIPERELRALGDRLRAIGLSAAFLARIARVAENLDDALRAPMRVWNARRMKDAAAIALRLFMLHDELEEAEARAVLGDPAPWVDAGLLQQEGRALSSRVHLALAGGVFCFGDRPGSGREAVPPLCGATLDLARAAMPAAGEPAFESAIDVGSGAGAVALLLARAARRVVAVDVDPRAVAFTRLNAMVNGATGLDVRLGDLFEPVAGQRFDRIAAHPPFLATRAGAAPSRFAHGGVRGDELSLRLLGSAARHLSRGGRAVLLADFPLFDGDALERRVRLAVAAAPVDVLVLQAPSKNLDEYCVQYAAARHPELGDAFRRAAIAERDHLECVGVRGISLAIVVLREGGPHPASAHAGPVPWTSRLEVRHGGDVPVTSEAIARLLAARALAHAPDAVLAAARLRVPAGAKRVAQPLPDGAPPSLVVHPPPGFPEWPAVLDSASAIVVEAIDHADSVLQAARALAHRRATSLEVATGEVVRLARDALLRGVLVIDPNGAG
ncbi:MAG: methyltransferase [Myxococcales bacterium]|nr:methyltransferase [Myxococcales bacterium]